MRPGSQPVLRLLRRCCFSAVVVARTGTPGSTSSSRPLFDSLGLSPKLSYIISTMAAIMANADTVTSIPLHQSTLRVLQRVKSAAETWDEFLINLTDDYLSPSLQAELDRRLKKDRVVTGAAARRDFEESRKSAR